MSIEELTLDRKRKECAKEENRSGIEIYFNLYKFFITKRIKGDQ